MHEFIKTLWRDTDCLPALTIDLILMINHEVEKAVSQYYGIRTLAMPPALVIKDEKPGYGPIYVINVYLPSSNYSNNEYDDAISIPDKAFLYCNDRGRVIILGDTNGQIGPAGGTWCHMPQSFRGKKFLKFLNDNNLMSVVAHRNYTGPEITFTGYDDQFGIQIDHVCIDKCDIDIIISCTVRDDSCLNTSDHRTKYQHWAVNPQFQISLPLGQRGCR